jgi:hypothetical protein
MQDKTQSIASRISSQIMGSRPYNNISFLVDVIKSKLQFENKKIEEIVEIARCKQASSLASYDCQFQSQSIQAQLYDLGIESNIVLFQDEISQHVALRVDNTLYDCTFGCTAGSEFNKKNQFQNNSYIINNKTYNVRTVLKESGHQKSDPMLQANFKVLSTDQPAKELYYYTSRNFITTIFLATLWKYNDDGNMIANLSITINQGKIMLSITSNGDYFKSELEKLNINSTIFNVALNNLCAKLDIKNTQVFNELFYIKANIQTLKDLKYLN